VTPFVTAHTAHLRILGWFEKLGFYYGRYHSDNDMTKFIINKKTEAYKSDVNLLNSPLYVYVLHTTLSLVILSCCCAMKGEEMYQIKCKMTFSFIMAVAVA